MTGVFGTDTQTYKRQCAKYAKQSLRAYPSLRQVEKFHFGPFYCLSDVTNYVITENLTPKLCQMEEL